MKYLKLLLKIAELVPAFSDSLMRPPFLSVLYTAVREDFLHCFRSRMYS